MQNYVLERSTDDIDYETLESVPSEGGTNNEFYNGYDMAPVKGDNFYRVRMDLKDGTVAYSNVKLIHYDDLMDFGLFPNPANDFVKLNLETEIGNTLDIVIYNNLGVVVKQFHLNEVYSKYYQMDIRDVREGHYIVKVTRDGKRPVAKTLMVGKP